MGKVPPMIPRPSLGRLFGVVAALAALAGCDSRFLRDSELAQVVREIRATRAQNAALVPGAPAAPLVTREMLAGFDDPLITAAIPKYGTTGLLGIAERNGSAITWLTPDRTAIVTRDGVVIATRGLVGDLASARVPDIRSERGETTRDHYYLGPNQRSVRERFSCNIATDSSETVRIVGTAYATTRVSERCRSDEASFTNIYWIENSGKIRKSRQWISTFVGYVDIEAVNH